MVDDSLKNKLSRFQSHISNPATDTKSNTIKKKKDSKKSNQFPDRYYKMAESMGGELITNHAGAYILVKKLYPFQYCHGNFCLNEISLDDLPLAAFTPLTEEGIINQKQLIFIDTETTGLGGSGVVPFLVGVGSLVENGFELQQYLLPDYSDESAMLEDLSEIFNSSISLVSYNGAAFDIPLLKDRLVINRTSKDIKHCHHIDLLHSSRRLFKRRLKDCRLTNIETEILGFNRIDDTPGYLVPSIYFEWLSSENLDLMSSVLEHNRLDIISLFFLLNIVAKIYTSRGDSLTEVDDLHSLSRLFGRRREHKTVEELFSKISQSSNDNYSPDLILYHSYNFKKIKKYDQAVSLWEKIADYNIKESYWANLELAKYYEHHKKEIQKALNYTLKAQKICPYGKTHQQNLEKRFRRLQNKELNR